MHFIRYINTNPTTDDCCICLHPLSNNVVAHRKIFAIRNNPPLHPIHTECIRSALKINTECPLCRAPIVPMFSLPTSLKEKLITVLKAGGVVGGVAAIARLGYLLVKPEDMLVGVSGLFGGLVGYAFSKSPDEIGKALVGVTAGAAIGTAGVLKYGTRTLIEHKQLIERLGLFVVSGAGGVGAAIGLAATIKVINTLIPRLPSLRDPDDEGTIGTILTVDEGPMRGILTVISGTFVATLVEKVVLKILTSLV